MGGASTPSSCSRRRSGSAAGSRRRSRRDARCHARRTRSRSAFAGHTSTRPAVPDLPALPPAEPQLVLLPDDRARGDGAARRGRRTAGLVAAPARDLLAGDAASRPGSPPRRSSSSSIPVKGFQYLLAVRAAGRAARRPDPRSLAAQPGCSAWRSVHRAAPLADDGRRRRRRDLACDPDLAPRSSRQPSEPLLAGSGGVPGGRELGRWIRTQRPEGRGVPDDRTVDGEHRRVLRSQRRAWGLSVCPNPLHRNPVLRRHLPTRTSRSGPTRCSTSSGTPSRRRGRSSSPGQLLAYAHRYHGVSSTRNRCSVIGRDGVAGAAAADRRLRGAAMRRRAVALVVLRRSSRQPRSARPPAARRPHGTRRARRSSTSSRSCRRTTRTTTTSAPTRAATGFPPDLCVRSTRHGRTAVRPPFHLGDNSSSPRDPDHSSGHLRGCSTTAGSMTASSAPSAAATRTAGWRWATGTDATSLLLEPRRPATSSTTASSARPSPAAS